MDKKALAVKAAVEGRWLMRASAHGLKPGTKAYARAEADFIAGASSAIHAADESAGADRLSSNVPPVWIINAMSGRPIVEAKKG